MKALKERNVGMNHVRNCWSGDHGVNRFFAGVRVLGSDFEFGSASSVHLKPIVR